MAEVILVMDYYAYCRWCEYKAHGLTASLARLRTKSHVELVHPGRGALLPEEACYIERRGTFHVEAGSNGYSKMLL